MRFHPSLQPAMGRTALAIVLLTGLGASSAVSADVIECNSPKGDVTLNGKIDVVDAQCAIVANLWATNTAVFPKPKCMGGPPALVDHNCDNLIQVGDVLLVLSRAVGVPYAQVLDGNANWCLDACEVIEPEGGILGDFNCNGGGKSVNTCHDGNPCTRDICIENIFGGCIHFPKKNGALCNADSDGCTRFDSCSAGVCVPGEPADCDDGSDCTTDECTSTGNNSHQCIHTAPTGPCSWEEPTYIDGDDYAINLPLGFACQHSTVTEVTPNLACDGECGEACEAGRAMTYSVPTEVGTSYRLTFKVADPLHDCADVLRVTLGVEGAIGQSWLLGGTNDWEYRAYEFEAVDTTTTVTLTQIFEECCACDSSCTGSCKPVVEDAKLALDWIRVEDLTYGGSCSPNPLDCDGWEAVGQGKLKICEAAEVGVEIPDVVSCAFGGFCGDICIDTVYDRGSWLRVDMEFCPHGTSDPACTAPTTFRLTDGTTATSTDRLMQVSLVEETATDPMPRITTRYVYDVYGSSSTFSAESIYVPSGSTTGYVYLPKPSTSEVSSWDRVDVHVFIGEGGISGAPSAPLYCSEVTPP